MGNFWKCSGKCSQGCSGKSECSGGCSGGCSGKSGVLQGVLPRVLSVERQQEEHSREHSGAPRISLSTWDRFRCTVEPSPCHIRCPQMLSALLWPQGIAGAGEVAFWKASIGSNRILPAPSFVTLRSTPRSTPISQSTLGSTSQSTSRNFPFSTPVTGRHHCKSRHLGQKKKNGEKNHFRTSAG